MTPSAGRERAELECESVNPQDPAKACEAPVERGQTLEGVMSVVL